MDVAVLLQGIFEEGFFFGLNLKISSGQGCSGISIGRCFWNALFYFARGKNGGGGENYERNYRGDPFESMEKNER